MASTLFVLRRVNVSSAGVQGLVVVAGIGRECGGGCGGGGGGGVSEGGS